MLSGVLGPSKVKILMLAGNEIGDAGAQALAENLPESLTYLNLAGNRIGTTAKEALRKACEERSVDTCWLD